jgi:hypothetical protein
MQLASFLRLCRRQLIININYDENAKTLAESDMWLQELREYENCISNAKKKAEPSEILFFPFFRPCDSKEFCMGWMDRHLPISTFQITRLHPRIGEETLVEGPQMAEDDLPFPDERV